MFFTLQGILLSRWSERRLDVYLMERQTVGKGRFGYKKTDGVDGGRWNGMQMNLCWCVLCLTSLKIGSVQRLA